MSDEMTKVLAGLIRQAKLNMWGKSIPTTAREAEFMAEWLIYRGVIVLPCKPGDTLYGIRRFVHADHEKVYSFKAPDEAWIIENKELFGKEIFLSESDARAAMKGDNQNV